MLKNFLFFRFLQQPLPSHNLISGNIQKWGISGCFCLLLLYTGNGNCILECRDNGTAVLLFDVVLYIIIL